MSYDDSFSRCAERRIVLGLAKVQRFVLLISMLAIGELTWGSCCLFWLGLIPGLLLPLCVLWTGPGQVCACAYYGGIAGWGSQNRNPAEKSQQGSQ